MDKTIHKFIGAVRSEIDSQLRGLGEFPKESPFEHGVQVGVYRGLQNALVLLEAVMNDEAGEEARR